MVPNFFERTVDIVTPKWIREFIRSTGIEYQKWRNEARKKMFDIAGCLTGQKFNDQV